MAKKIFKTKNGINFIVHADKSAKSASVYIFIAVGPYKENVSNNGISHFLEHILLRGTKKFPNSDKLLIEIDNIGGNLEAFTSKEYMSFGIKTKKENIDIALSILNEIIFHPKLSLSDIEIERRSIIDECVLYEENPMMNAGDIFENQFVGMPIIGTKKNINSFTQKMLNDFYCKNFTSNNIIICLAGNIEKSVIEKAKKKFSEKKKKSLQSIEIYKKKNNGSNIRIYKKKANQIHFSIGYKIGALRDKDEYVLRFISVMLGGCLSSRNNINLREKRGLVYYIQTNAEFFSRTGYLATQAAVMKKDLISAIREIIFEYNRIKSSGISNKEINKIKKIISSGNSIQSETSDDMALWIGCQAVTILNQKGKIEEKFIFTPEEFTKKFANISAKDIYHVVNKVFTKDNMYLTVYGQINNYQKAKLKQLFYSKGI